MTRLCSSRFEREARQLGWTRIAGLDEAGRGALFGPVVAAAVILNPKRRIVGLDDSKKLLPERRTELAARIRRSGAFLAGGLFGQRDGSACQGLMRGVRDGAGDRSAQ